MRELRDRRDRGANLFILDVREPHEYQLVNLKGHLIPWGELPKRVNELDSSRDIVVHCHTGVRSATAVRILRHMCCTKAVNLAGGIDRWAIEVDPKMVRY